MSVVLRILLVLVSIGTTWWILHKIRKSKVKMEDAIFWMFFSGLLLVLAIFPQLSFYLSSLLGIDSPANLVFLIIICLLLEKIFTLSIVVSQLEEKISVLSSEVAIRTQDENARLEKIEKESEKGAVRTDG